MNTATANPIDPGFGQASELLDVLYEILASGLEPESATVSTSDIETFLHQHARSPKSRAEIEAFFASGGLPMQVDVLTRDSGLRLTAVAPQSISAGSGELPAPDSNTGRHAIAAAARAPIASAPAPAPSVAHTLPPRRDMTGTSIALVAVCLALLGVCVVGGWSMMGLRDELARSQATQERTHAMLERVQARTEQMGQQLNAQSNTMADQRADVDRLVQTFLPETLVENAAP